MRRSWLFPIVGILVIGALAAALVLTFVAPPADAAVSTSATITYNLFATDGYVGLPDGRSMYNYGFVGGRAGVPLTYMKSVTPSAESGSSGTTGAYDDYTYNGIGTLATGAPTPTGGKTVGDELALAGNAQWPAPIIYASVGDVVQIRFKNLGVVANPDAPNDPHSIHLHGLDVNAANDGVPETSVGAVPANTDVPGAGNVIVYMFSPKNPGTTCITATRKPTSTSRWACTAHW